MKQNKKRRKSKMRFLSPQECVIIISLCITAIMMLVIYHTTPTIYEVANYNEDNQKETIHYYHSLSAALDNYDKLIEKDYHNPAILQDNKLVAIRYGVVDFKTDNCMYNTEFYYDENNSISDKAGYTNGCYGADGAYLATSRDGNYYKFKLSAAVGWVEKDKVNLLNYFDDDDVKSVNHYERKEGSLVHRGTSDISSETYAINIEFGTAPVSLNENLYYSYDGHYFYRSFPDMIDDYRNDSHELAANKNEEYINYFQFLDHRSKSSYDSADVNWYIEKYLGFNGKMNVEGDLSSHSQLYKEGKAFIDNQNKYGVNAIMMFALAINESGFGKSSIAFQKNNLFGHAAYDESPGESADKYKSVSDSIKAHARVYLSLGYLNPCDGQDGRDFSVCAANAGNRYNGGYLGDKNSGLNVRYASDPYWGEKAAAYYRSFDTVLNGLDQNKYTIMKINQRSAPLYASANRDQLVYRTPNTPYSYVIVLKKVKGESVDGNDTWYQVQSDGIVKNGVLAAGDGTYNFKENVVYIPAKYIEGEFAE